MIAAAVITENQLHARLQELGFKPTKEKTATGTFWKNEKTGRHVLVPNKYGPGYPPWMVEELMEIVGIINPYAIMPLKKKPKKPAQ